METIQYSKLEAVKAYNEGSVAEKALLKKLFGDQLFTKITDRIKSVDDAVEFKRLKLSDIINERDTKDEIAYKVIKFVVSVLNEDWVPDYNNTDQAKWEPYWRWNGSRLVFDGAYHWYDFSSVGSRLCYRDKETLLHGVKILETYYNDLINR